MNVVIEKHRDEARMATVYRLSLTVQLEAVDEMMGPGIENLLADSLLKRLKHAAAGLQYDDITLLDRGSR